MVLSCVRLRRYCQSYLDQPYEFRFGLLRVALDLCGERWFYKMPDNMDGGIE